MTLDEPITEKRPVGYPQPFPWHCVNCARLAVRPQRICYEKQLPYEGSMYSIVVENLEMPICDACGQRNYTEDVDRQVLEPFRHQLHLLTPEQIRDGIARLSTTTQELSERLGIAEELLSRWAYGLELQPRAMDNLLRLFFGLPEVRAVLRGKDQDPEFGIRETSVSTPVETTI